MTVAGLHLVPDVIADIDRARLASAEEGEAVALHVVSVGPDPAAPRRPWLLVRRQGVAAPFVIRPEDVRGVPARDLPAVVRGLLRLAATD